jgi:hypothetical protein
LLTDPLYIETVHMDHSESSTWSKSGQEEESSHHILCQCPAKRSLALHG